MFLFIQLARCTRDVLAPLPQYLGGMTEIWPESMHADLAVVTHLSTADCRWVHKELHVLSNRQVYCTQDAAHLTSKHPVTEIHGSPQLTTRLDPPASDC